MTDMKKAREGGYLKTTPEPEKEKGESKVFKIVIGVLIGIIVLWLWRLITTYVWKEEPIKKDEQAKQKIEDVDIEQKGETLSNVTGIDMSNNPHDTEMGKAKIHQEGKNLRNVTGMKIEFDANSGEVELKDKVEIKQQGTHGQSSVTFNADQPGVKIAFNKKSEDSNE